MPPRLVIFDCDGVLVDSEPLTSRAMQRALARYGLPLELDEIQASFHGISNDQIHDTVLTHWGVRLPDDIASLIEEVERVAVEDGLLAIPGVADAVRVAALAAGMRVLAYVANPTSDVADAREVVRFTDMASLPALLGLNGAPAQ